MATTQYRYLFTDVLTNAVLAELPITGVNFTQQLNTAGTFTGHILLSGVNVTGLNVLNATIPARCAVWVDRNGELVWGGVIWNRTYHSGTQKLTITAREWESYFERRRITQTVSFTNVDQALIAQTLIQNAQSATYGNIGVIVGSETTGVTVSRTYYNYELKSVFGAILDLSRATNGFDFNIYASYDNDGNPQKTFVIGYPRYGNTWTTNPNSKPVWELTGNIVNYEYPEDGSIAANSVYAIGAGSNEGKLISLAQDTSKFTAGWPLLEDQITYSDVTDSTYLGNLASGYVGNVSYPPTTIKLVAPPYINPTLNDFDLGDSARIRIVDDRFPAGLDATYRIVAINVTPGEDAPEEVTLTLTTTTN